MPIKTKYNKGDKIGQHGLMFMHKTGKSPLNYVVVKCKCDTLFSAPLGDIKSAYVKMCGSCRNNGSALHVVDLTCPWNKLLTNRII